MSDIYSIIFNNNNSVAALQQELQNYDLNTFLKITKFEHGYSSILPEAFEQRKDNFLEAFFHTFKDQLNHDTIVEKKYVEPLNLKNLLVTCSLFMSKSIGELYLNNDLFMKKDGLIVIDSGTFCSEEVLGNRLNKGFKNNFEALILQHFYSIANKETYLKNFSKFLTYTNKSHVQFLKGIELYNSNQNNIESKVIIDEKIKNNFNFSHFYKQKYIQYINKDPALLSMASSNIKNSKYLLSLIEDKSKYLEQLYNNRDVKYYSENKKTLNKAPVPLIYAASEGNSDFINLLIDFGYVLNNDEILFIHKVELSEKIKNLNDITIHSDLLTGNTVEEKMIKLFMLSDENKINDSDFNSLFRTLDLSQIKNEHFLIHHSKTNYDTVATLYYENKASFIDVLLHRENGKSLLLDDNIPKLSKTQKSYFNSLLKNYFRLNQQNSEFKDSYFSLLGIIQKNINENIISDLYDSQFNEKTNSSLPFYNDYHLSKIIKTEELLENKDIILSISANMHRTYLEAGNTLREDEVNRLTNLIVNDYQSIVSKTGNEDKIKKSLTLFADNISYFETKLPGISISFYNQTDYKINKIKDEHRAIIDKEILKSSLNSVIPKQKNRL